MMIFSLGSWLASLLAKENPGEAAAYDHPVSLGIADQRWVNGGAQVRFQPTILVLI
ncbi:Uncharacterised protein [Serratia fonticola]|uniref:Uncharacterized protein n=1 Tax=Serratia fonticola TaxID=47917 RepID=A0A4U9U324_SERFO|nr:Uncharacterised protein [Serratia fonticola]